jgi:hypothetical protein
MGGIMYHFIYKITSKSGKYYIGRHSTNKIEDGYVGSGKWIRSIKNKSELSREIIEFCCEQELKNREKHYLSEHVGQPDCMNFNTSPVGFSSGDLNPSKSAEERKKRSMRAIGENNPAKRPEVRKKISDSQKGKTRPKWKMSEQGKKNISEARKGLKYSEEGKKKLSESRKKEYAQGKRIVPDFTGKTHSEEYKTKMKEYFHSRPKKECPHCGESFHPATYGRWHGDKCKRLISPCDKP